jgi:hypothetical protein
LALASQAKAFPKGDLNPTAKIIPITEQFQHFLAEMNESFWGDLYGQTRQAWQRFFELQSERQRGQFSGWGRYERIFSGTSTGCIAIPKYGRAICPFSRSSFLFTP